jgi:hypothetical protein
MGGYKDAELVGTAPDASYYLFITEDSSSENPVEESLWVEQKRQIVSDIINTSILILITPRITMLFFRPSCYV